MEELTREFVKEVEVGVYHRTPKESAEALRKIAARIAEVHAHGRSGDLLRRGFAVAAAIADYADWFESEGT